MKNPLAEMPKVTVFVPNRLVTTSIDGKLPAVPVSVSMPPWVSKSTKQEEMKS